jgi:hypothetical protein
VGRRHVSDNRGSFEQHFRRAGSGVDRHVGLVAVAETGTSTFRRFGIDRRVRNVEFFFVRFFVVAITAVVVVVEDGGVDRGVGVVVEGNGCRRGGGNVVS